MILTRNRRVLAVLLAAAMLLSLTAILSVPARADTPFSDVPTGKYYTDAVQWCYEKGYIKGYGDGTFRPDQNVTRAEMAAIIDSVEDLEHATESGLGNTTNTFSDVPNNVWYTQFVLRCVKYGLMSGYSKTQFGPNDNVNREQAAVILSLVADVVRVDGHTTFADDASISSWALSSVKPMAEVGLLAGIGENKFGPKTNLTRAMLCQILYVAKRPGLRLVHSVSVYTNDSSKGWTFSNTRTYLYDNNGYPVSISLSSPDPDNASETTLNYEYSNGQPVKRTSTKTSIPLVQTATYKNGKLDTVVSKDSTSESTTTYEYGNNDAYFTKLSFINRLDTVTMKEEDNVTVTTQNGLLKQTVNDGTFANTNDGEEEQWAPFNGTYTALYDNDGILQSTSVVYKEGNPPAKDIWTITNRNDLGLVTEIIRSTQAEGSAPVEMERYVFDYNMTIISEARYATMINDHIITSENNFYRYNWY